MKLIMENWKRYLKEGAFSGNGPLGEPIAAGDPGGAGEIGSGEHPKYREANNPNIIFQLIPPNLKVICNERSCNAERVSVEEFQRLQLAAQSGELECVANCPGAKEPVPQP